MGKIIDGVGLNGGGVFDCLSVVQLGCEQWIGGDILDIDDKNKPAVAKILVYLSVVCVVLAIIGAMGSDLYLASTQWMLIAIIFAVWGTYILVEAYLRLNR